MARTTTDTKKTVTVKDAEQRPTAVLEFKTTEDALNFAVDEGTNAYEYYMDLAVRVKDPWTREALEGFAAEELGHIERFVAMRHSPRRAPKPHNVPGLQIVEYVTAEVWPHENMDTREAYVTALKVEGAAYRRYMDLADRAATPEIQEVFLALAEEVAKHKQKLETEYDDYVFAQN
jgi:rubrerythrin